MDPVLLLVALGWLALLVFVVALATAAARADRVAEWALTVRRTPVVRDWQDRPVKSYAELRAIERGLEDGSVIPFRPRSVQQRGGRVA